MAKNKLKKFQDLQSLPHVYQNEDPKNPKLERLGLVVKEMKGNWVKNQFQNQNPLILELACGRGEYTEALAEAYPNQNFIGVDVKGARIWLGATNCLDKNLKNAAFLRTRIEQIQLFFGPDEVSEIWITFPDPFLRESKENRRLTSKRFLDTYQHFIAKNAKIHLKTDDQTLYLFTLETLANYSRAKIEYQCDDIYAQELENDALRFKTYYERSHLANGRKIKYIRFTIN